VTKSAFKLVWYNYYFDNLKGRKQEIIRKLLVEVQTNKKLEIEIGAN
jgi:hypothetical protein